MMRTLNYLKNKVSKCFDFIISQIDNRKYFQMNVQGENPLKELRRHSDCLPQSQIVLNIYCSWLCHFVFLGAQVVCEFSSTHGCFSSLWVTSSKYQLVPNSGMVGSITIFSCEIHTPHSIQRIVLSFSL